ncbi:MAG: cupin [Cyanobacteria bacterium P01_D01_bin.156]
MEISDWLVTETGQCQPRPAAKTWDLIRDRYYFHRFLTEIIDLLDQAPNELEEWNFLPQIRMQVRQLVTNSYWLQTQLPTVDQTKDSSVLTLYDEIGYPLTVQNVIAKPGMVSPIHNHGTWGVVAILKGKERHTFWRRVDGEQKSFKIELVGEKIFGPGEIVSFMPQTIHQVSPVENTSTLTFQLYGDTQPSSRYEFQPDQATAKPF